MALTKSTSTIPTMPVRWIQRRDVLIVVFFLCVLMMMVIPLTGALIDVFIAINLMLATIVLLSVMYIKKIVDFSVFPSLLLMSTVYRLAIEVSTARVILSGKGESISIVKAFGTFVVGGNYVVGVVIFIILTIIQLLVIVRGTTRVSEVAARFTLDAMPGKQMAIDADLNAGYITEKESRERRAEVRKEADFYGAMDGAAKFIQGDVWAAIIITSINIIFGIILGVTRDHMPLLSAVQAYTIYTVGCALSAQIPAFLISVATGLLVTRATTEVSLSSDLVQQLTSKPQVLYIAAGILTIFALLPGFPKLPLLLLGTGIGFVAFTIEKRIKKEEVVEREAAHKREIDALKKPESVVSLLTTDQMELEIGYSLIPFVDPEQGGDLLDRVTIIRRQQAIDMGIIVPPIRIRDNIQLKANTYAIKIRGINIAQGEIKIDHYLAMEGGDIKEKIIGEPTYEPIFGLPAFWIKEDQRERVEKAGYTVVDSPSIIATHLSEVIKQNASLILSRQEVQTLIDNLKIQYSTVVNELIPNLMTIGEIQKILHNLLDEGISIRDMVTILETLADWAGKTKDPLFLTERVRESLSRVITKQYQTEDGRLLVLTLDPKLEEQLATNIRQAPEGETFSVDPSITRKLIESIKSYMETQPKVPPILLTTPRLRRHLKNIFSHMLPLLVVLSYNEISRNVKVQSYGILK